MQVPSQKFYRTSGRLDNATASGDAMTSRFVEGSLESVPPDLCPRQICQGFLYPVRLHVFSEVYRDPWTLDSWMPGAPGLYG